MYVRCVGGSSTSQVHGSSHLPCTAVVLFSVISIIYQVPDFNCHDTQLFSLFFMHYVTPDISTVILLGDNDMASSEAAKRAVKKYDQEKIDRIAMRVPKGKREVIQAHAQEQGESINAFLNRAVDEAIERDRKKRREG